MVRIVITVHSGDGSSSNNNPERSENCCSNGVAHTEPGLSPAATDNVKLKELRISHEFGKIARFGFSCGTLPSSVGYLLGNKN